MNTGHDYYRAIAVIKPDGLKTHIHDIPFEDVFDAWLRMNRLAVLDKVTAVLSPEEVELLYPNLRVPKDHLIPWKETIIMHMSEASVRGYLICGLNALPIVQAMKYHIRRICCDTGDKYDQVVANIMHVSDAHDFEVTASVLFPSLDC